MTGKKTNDKSPTKDERESTDLALPTFGLPRIFEEYMKPFDQFMAPLFPSSMSSPWNEFGGKESNIDLQDRGDHFLLTAELPGFEKKDVEVRASSNGLDLRAEKRSEDSKSSRTSYSFFQRYMSLPERVSSEKVEGTMKNGILELKLPKAEPKPKETFRGVRLN